MPADIENARGGIHLHLPSVDGQQPGESIIAASL